MNWYAYIGTGSPFLPGSYIKMSTSSTCAGSCIVCAVFLNEAGLIPANAFSSTIIGHIANALGTGTSQPTVNPLVTLRC